MKDSQSFNLETNPAYHALTIAAKVGAVGMIVVGLLLFTSAWQLMRRGERDKARRERMRGLVFVMAGVGLLVCCLT